MLILLVLIALIARADAEPEAASIALAVRYADILTGVEPGGASYQRAGDGDEADGNDEENDEDDGADARVDPDDDDGEEDARADPDDDEAQDASAGAEDRAEAAIGATTEANGDGDETDGRELIAVSERASGADHGDGGDAGGADGGPGNPGSPGGSGGPGGPDAGDADDAGDAGDAGAAGAAGDAGDGADGGGGQLALLDAEQAPPGATTGDATSFATGAAGAEETYEAWMRHRRPSRLGRLDLGVAVRQSWHAPMHAPAYRSNELWLVATWRR